MRLDGEAPPAIGLSVQDQPRPGHVAIGQPRLVEEGHPQRASGIGHRGLDQRPHAAPAHGSRRDPLDLDHDRGRLALDQIGKRACLAPVARQVLEQLTDRVQPERGGSLGRLCAADPQGSLQLTR